jgi:hypothetical protein
MAKQPVMALVVCCVLWNVVLTPNQALAQAMKNPVSHSTNGYYNFEGVTTILVKKTSVPVRLPKFLPDNGDKEHPIFAILESGDPSSYEIQLAWTNDCKGGNSCHYGTIRGSTTPLHEGNAVMAPVSLLYDIEGYFIDFTCGAHCDDSTVGWQEGGYYYSVSLKAEKMGVLVRVANSAIASGQAGNPKAGSDEALSPR